MLTSELKSMNSCFTFMGKIKLWFGGELNMKEDGLFWKSVWYSRMIWKKYQIVIICTDIAIVMWFSVLEGVIIFTLLFSFSLKNMIKRLQCDFCRDLYQTKVLP